FCYLSLDIYHSYCELHFPVWYGSNPFLGQLRASRDSSFLSSLYLFGGLIKRLCLLIVWIPDRYIQE
ncbi:MAG: hypothetical protein KBH15_01825, partial [Candidatus Atribacteria bacterium]|nr:hypothetical protein [Candidatus Atribacteria bacterium]